MAITDPTDLPDLLAWYQPADISSVAIDGSNNVTQINDKSGNGHHLSTITGTPKSETRTQVNGLNVIDVDVPSFVSTVIAPDILIPYTKCGTFKFDSNPAGSMVTDGSVSKRHSFNTNGTEYRLFSAGGDWFVGTPSSDITTEHTYIVTFDGAATSLHIDGVLVSFSQTASSSGNMDTLAYGGLNGVVGMDGYFGEQFVLTDTPTAQEIIDISDYLAASLAVGPSIATIVPDPAITGDELTVAGATFEAVQGTGGITQEQGAVVVALNIIAWSDTETTADSAIIESTGLKYGIQTLRVTNDSAQEGTRDFVANPPTDNAFIDLTSVATSGLRITAIADLAANDQIRYEALLQQGGSPTIFTVVVNADATFSVDGATPDGTFTFQVRAWDDGDQTWGTAANQTVIIGAAAAPTVTGPDTVIDGTSFTLTGTDLNTGTPTVALKETAIAASSKSQTIGTPTSTTIPNVQGDSGQDQLRDAAGFGPLDGIAIKASILATGTTVAVHEESFDNGTDPEAIHVIANGITVDAALTAVQTMISEATTTPGQSFYGSNIVTVQDNHQAIYPTTTNGVTLTSDVTGNGEFTFSLPALVSAGGSISFDTLYYSPSTKQWTKASLTLTEEGLNISSPTPSETLNNFEPTIFGIFDSTTLSILKRTN